MKENHGEVSSKERRFENEELLKTGDVLKITGISRQMLQQYIVMGLIREKEKTKGGHRKFGRETIKKIRLIQQLNKSGYTLRDIREVFKSGMT
ncbi:MerR family transcriptional regulator [Planctomycetota bacterium]